MSDSGIPAALIAGKKKPRFRVDVAQTSFFEGREFRTFYEYSIPTGTSIVGKFSSPVDFILFQQNLTIDSGALRVSTIVGATELTTFDTPLPVIGKNQMSERPTPIYSSKVSVSIGGTISGGTTVDVARIVSAGATAQEFTIGSNISDERGLPSGDYYVVVENISNGTATGVYSSFWEERD